MTLIRFIAACIRRFIPLLNNSKNRKPKDESNNSSTERIVRLSTLDGYTLTDSNETIITIKE